MHEIDGVRFDIEVDDNQDVWLVLECQECEQTVRRHADEVTPDSDVTCPCGKTVFHLAGDGLRELQTAFAELRSAIRDFGK